MSLKTNFWIDFVAFIGFLIAFEPHVTGVPLHEWLTISGVGTLVIHLLIHWDWVIRLTQRFFKNLFHISRLNYVIAVVIFLGFISIMTSGLMISESFMPFFGLSQDTGRGWYAIHDLASKLTMLVVALHFALHWDWVKRAFMQVFIEPLRNRSAKTQAGKALD